MHSSLQYGKNLYNLITRTFKKGDPFCMCVTSQLREKV